jgi:hypothetical protein
LLAAASTTHDLNAATGARKTLLLILMVLKELGSQLTASPAAASISDRQVANVPALGEGRLRNVYGAGGDGAMYLLRDAHENPSTIGLLLDGHSMSIVVQAGSSWAKVQLRHNVS